MDCFLHSGVAAVGTCKSCGKGICHACAADLGDGLACRNRCESKVKTLTAFIDRNIQNAARNERLVSFGYSNRSASAVFYVLIGALFLGYGFYQFERYPHGAPDFLLLGMGVLFLGFGIFIFLRSRAAAARAEQSVGTPR